jgi:hypothetical protein
VPTSGPTRRRGPAADPGAPRPQPTSPEPSDPVRARLRAAVDGWLAATADQPLAYPPADWSLAHWEVLVADHPELRDFAARSPTVPEEVLRALAADPDWRVRSAAAARRNLPPDLFPALARDRSEPVRSTVAANAKAPLELVAALTRDRRESVAAVARYQLDTRRRDELRRVTASGDPARAARAVEALIATHLALTADQPLAELPADWPLAVWERFVATCPDYRYWCAHSANVPEEILHLLATDPNWRVRARVAQKRRTPAALLARLARDPHEAVRQRVAANPKAPRELVAELADDPAEHVARVARRHLDTRPEAAPPDRDDDGPDGAADDDA